MTWLAWLTGTQTFELPDYEPAAGPPGVVSRSSLHADAVENPFTFLGSESDKGSVARPTHRLELQQQELAWLFEQSGLARRIVCLYPAEEIRGGWTVKDATSKTNPLRSEERRLSLFQRVQEARWKERLRGGSVLYPVIDDGQPLTEPLDVSKIKKIENITVYEGVVEAQAVAWEGDPRSPIYNQVRIWQITPISMGSAGCFRIHASRVIHFPGEDVTADLRWKNGGHGQSVLEAAWEAIRNREQLSAAGASLVQELIVPVIQINDLEARATGDQGTSFLQRLQLMARARSMLNMVMLGQGETFKRDPISITGFDDLATCSKEDVAAATSYPITKLFSPPASGLGANAEGDRESWAEAVHASQNQRLYERLIALYSLVYAQTEGPTRGKVPEEWDVEFGSLDRPSAKTQAEIDDLTATADEKRIAAQIVSPDEVRTYGSSAKAIEALNLDEEEESESAPEPTDVDPVMELGPTGAQITAMLGVVESVAAGGISPDGAVALITALFPAIEDDKARRIVAGARTATPAPNAEKPEPEQKPNSEPVPAK